MITANDELVNLYLKDKINFKDIYELTKKTVRLKIFKRYFNKKPKNPEEIINLVKKVRFKINQLCNI